MFSSFDQIYQKADILEEHDESELRFEMAITHLTTLMKLRLLNIPMKMTDLKLSSLLKSKLKELKGIPV